jgi:hypothetical protein
LRLERFFPGAPALVKATQTRRIPVAKEKPYITEPRTQKDLEERLSRDHVPASAVNEGSLLVNPNPFGSEAYVGTDPIYQNHASDTEKPLNASKGVEKKAEEQLRNAHKFSDDDEVVDDAGFGGKAARTRVQSPVQSMNAADYEPSDK